MAKSLGKERGTNRAISVIYYSLSWTKRNNTIQLRPVVHTEHEGGLCGISRFLQAWALHDGTA